MSQTNPNNDGTMMAPILHRFALAPHDILWRRYRYGRYRKRMKARQHSPGHPTHFRTWKSALRMTPCSKSHTISHQHLIYAHGPRMMWCRTKIPERARFLTFHVSVNRFIHWCNLEPEVFTPWLQSHGVLSILFPTLHSVTLIILISCSAHGRVN